MSYVLNWQEKYQGNGKPFAREMNVLHLHLICMSFFLNFCIVQKRSRRVLIGYTILLGQRADLDVGLLVIFHRL